jgi:serpin B
MGMTDAFDDAKADFTRMCATTPDGGSLVLEDVLQKAMLSLDENGIEAAAATAVIGIAISANLDYVAPVVLNRPFLVAIIDQPTGAILFLGHVADPTEN